jgi:MFS family permease
MAAQNIRRRVHLIDLFAAHPTSTLRADTAIAARSVMGLNVRHPMWLPAAPAPGISVFALLYFVETFARASLATLIPLQAYELLQSEQKVSFLYTSIGVFSLALSFAIPWLIRRFARRWVYTLGAVALIVAAACFATVSLGGQAAGMLTRVFGTACLNVTLSLYVLDFIAKRQYVRNDSVRLAFSMVGWSVAPYMGVWLYTRFGPEVAYGTSAVWAVVLMAVFWYLRLSDVRAISPARMAPANPVRFVRRFLAQPRLRLAWLIAFGRSSFWSTFFIFAPILMVSTGYGEHGGGLLVSVGNAMLITVIAWGRLGERYGVRRICVFSFAGMAVVLWAAGYATSALPLVTAGFLLLATFFACGLDAVGAVPFYRAVHPNERPEMTSVYRTYLDMGELLPSMVYTALLGFFGIGAVFVANGCLALFCGALCWRYLNRRL